MNLMTRYVTLRRATMKHRVAKHEGRDHVVVPVVALVEGVIHPVNAPHAELVRAERFSSSLAEWDGQPIYAGHPMKDGVPIDGHLPEVLPSSFGFVRSASVRDKQLIMEAWIDPVRAATAEASKRILERAQADEAEVIEVSVGVFVAMEDTAGEYNGKAYKGEWMVLTPNHLALLNERQVGACSVEMGCGALRSASNACGCKNADQPSMRLQDDGTLEVLGGPGSGNFGHTGRPGAISGSGGGGRDAMDSHNNARINHEAAAAMHTAAAQFYRGTTKSSDTTDLTGKAAQMSKEAHAMSGATGTKPFTSEAAHSSAVMARRTSGADNKAGYHEQAAAQHQQAGYFHADAHAFSSQVKRMKASEQSPFARLLSLVMPRVAEMPAGASNRDMEEALHDAIVDAEPGASSVYISDWYSDLVVYQLYSSTGLNSSTEYYTRTYTVEANGDITLDLVRTPVDRVISWIPDDDSMKIAELSEQEPRLKAACGCGGHDACRCTTREATLAAQGDQDMDRKHMIAALIANPQNLVKNPKSFEALPDDELTALQDSLKAAADKMAAYETALKAAQEKANAEPAEMTEAQFMKVAPASYRERIGRELAREEAEKTTLVTTLKAAQQAFDEPALAAMPIDQLRKFAEAFKVERPHVIDFSLRGVPHQRVAEGEFDGQTPDPYATAAAK